MDVVVSAVRSWVAAARRRPLVTVAVGAVTLVVVGGLATYLLVLGAPGRFDDDLDLAVPGAASSGEIVAVPRLPAVPDGRGESLGQLYGFGPGWPPTDWQPAQLPASTRVYLVFSTGGDGLDSEAAARLGITDYQARGVDRRTDSIMLAIVDRETRRAALLSVPRDTWVYHRGNRINAIYVRDGLQAYVDEMTLLTGLPIHHVVRVSFQGFGELVDALGGIEVPVDRPLRDRNSRLYLPEAGCWRLDGRAALAYARSRYTETLVGDRWRADASASDFGRMQRQRQLTMLAWEQNRGPGLVRSVPSLFGAARRGITIDRNLGIAEMRDLASAFQSVSAGSVEQYQLPTKRRRIGAADAQIVDADAAWPVVAHLRAWPRGIQAGTASPAPTDRGDEPPPPTAAPRQNRAALASDLCAAGQPRLRPWPVRDVVAEWERQNPRPADDDEQPEPGDDLDDPDDTDGDPDDEDADETDEDEPAGSDPIGDLIGGDD